MKIIQTKSFELAIYAQGEVTIRTSSLADLDTVTDFMQPVYADTYPNDRGIKREMFEDATFHDHLRSYLEEKLANPLVTMLVEHLGVKAVGTIGLEIDPKDPSSGEVWGFYVDPGLQNKGLGTKLWASLMGTERVKSLKKLTLTVAKDTPIAQRFYEQNGFIKVGEVENNWPSWTEEHLVNQYWKMEKDLSPKSKADHARVAPTAYGVAYLRTFSGIPLTKEMSEGLEHRMTKAGEPNTHGKFKEALAPQLEARYKLVDRLLIDSGATQVVELAAGIAPRGVNFARSNPSMRYVELDLPGVVSEKRAIFADMHIVVPGNLLIEEGDALREDDIARAVSTFAKGEPVAVVNEGLMRYLSFDEKKILANNVAGLLRQFGGVWITPDISLKQALSRENDVSSGHIQSLTQTTGIDINQNVFEDEQHAIDFFEGLGFSVERHSFLEVSDQLASPANLNISPEEVQKLNEPCVAFVMKLAA